MPPCSAQNDTFVHKGNDRLVYLGLVIIFGNAAFISCQKLGTSELKGNYLRKASYLLILVPPWWETRDPTLPPRLAS
jgi:hypothetical protein